MGNQNLHLTGNGLANYIRNMKVRIRPRWDQRSCPECGQKFKLDNAFRCLKHKTAKPDRFDIDVPRRGHNTITIRHDKQGQILPRWRGNRECQIGGLVSPITDFCVGLLCPAQPSGGPVGGMFHVKHATLRTYLFHVKHSDYAMRTTRPGPFHVKQRISCVHDPLVNRHSAIQNQSSGLITKPLNSFG